MLDRRGMPRIAAILVYPVVGCRGLRVKTATWSARGLEGDRQWVVTGADGTPVGPDALGRVYVEQKGADLVLVAAGMDRLPLVDAASATAWFTKLLGRPVAVTALAEPGAPLATSTASLATLNTALPDSVGIERFQPNFVLEGMNPFDEDRWSSVKLVGVRCAASTPQPPRLPFGVVLTPRLEGSATMQVRAGQSLDVEPGVRSDRPGG